MTTKRPVACDMRGAPDTVEQRAAAYRRLFGAALRGRDREPRMARFRFLRSAVDEALLQLLVERERACCRFFDMQVRTSGDEVWWEIRVEDDPDAEALLEELYRLPERVVDDPTGTARRFERGSTYQATDRGVLTDGG